VRNDIDVSKEQKTSLLHRKYGAAWEKLFVSVRLSVITKTKGQLATLHCKI
jgi:hypothetical protein